MYQCRFFSSWQVERCGLIHETEVYPVSLSASPNQPRSKSAMGKAKGSETKEDDLSSGPYEDRSAQRALWAKVKAQAKKTA